MYYNNRGNRQFYGPGCSIFGCMIALIVMSFIVRGSLYFFFRYFWVILLVGVIVWAYNKFTNKDQPNNQNKNNGTNKRKSDWHRDYEDRGQTSYHNKERDFEEVDDDDEFDDF